MVQERLGSSLTKGTTYQNTKDKKDSAAASASQHSPNKTIGGKYGAWGSVFKNKQNFVDMHYS